MTKSRNLVYLWSVLTMAIALAAFVAVAEPARAAAITVNTTGDENNVDGDCSLREAVAAANTNAAVDGCVAGSGADTIGFAPALTANGDATIGLSIVGDTSLGASALAVTSEVEIRGPSGENGVTLARASGAPEMRLFYVKGAASNLTLRNLTLAGGSARGGDGGLAGASGGGGGGAGLGGAVFNEGNLSIQGSTLSDNTARGGRGGANPGYSSGDAGAAGGGPNPGSGGRGSDGSGDGFYGGDGGFGGGGGGGGGGFHNENGLGFGGSGGFGGGSGSNGDRGGRKGGNGGFGGGGGGGGEGNFMDGQVTGGAGGGGAGLGGAIFNRSGNVTLSNSTLSGNTAQGGAGGNGGSGFGGAVFNLDGGATVRSSTFAGNTVSGGTGGTAGGGIYSLRQSGATATLDLKNTLLAESTGGADCQNNGGTATGGGNLIESNDGCAGVVSSQDPSLGPLDSNGGPTSTHALLPDSPAVDAGTTTGCPTTDQRGTKRPQDGDRDGAASCDIGAFELTNRPPAATDDAYTTDEDRPLRVPAPGVLVNDTDPEGDRLAAEVFSYPGHGTLELRPSGSFVYTPDDGYSGEDSFTYEVSDGNGGTDTATVQITVNAANKAPDAQDDSATTQENEAKDIDVLANDSDPESDSLSVTNASDPAHGTATVSSDGKSIRYQPDPGYSGTDSFTYQIGDGKGGTGTATVSVTVSATNDDPVASDDSYAIKGKTLSVPASGGVLNNDTDPEGDDLMARVVSAPSRGKLTLNSDGSFTYKGKIKKPLTFVYEASDGSGGTDQATVTISRAKK